MWRRHLKRCELIVVVVVACAADAVFALLEAAAAMLGEWLSQQLELSWNLAGESLAWLSFESQPGPASASLAPAGSGF